MAKDKWSFPLQLHWTSAQNAGTLGTQAYWIWTKCRFVSAVEVYYFNAGPLLVVVHFHLACLLKKKKRFEMQQPAWKSPGTKTFELAVKRPRQVAFTMASFKGINWLMGREVSEDGMLTSMSFASFYKLSILYRSLRPQVLASNTESVRRPYKLAPGNFEWCSTCHLRTCEIDLVGSSKCASVGSVPWN